MRKFTFVLMMMLAFAGFTMAQTIEDFECIKMNLFSQGTTGSLSVVPNPDTAGNQSLYVGKMVRAKDGDPWQGWYATLPTPINITTNKYVHIKVWKPRISPTCFKVEGGAGNSGDTYPMNEITEVNKWVEVVFDMSTTPASGEYVKIVLIPDFLTPVGLTEDITIYFDNLYANNDPAVGSAPVQLMENYETIPLNYMLGGADDLSTMTLIPNPDKSGVNLSDYVIKFHRDMNGVPWGGFWSALPVPADVTTNKYAHAKVWKPRISPVKLKLEGGAAGTLEAPSMNTQTKIGAWEDFVFDFTSITGTYPILAFMPDFADPVNLTSDIDIYFDDFRLNSDPNPMLPPEQVFSVDMNNAGLTAGQQVFISGAIGGINGTWNEPGTNPYNEMFDPDGDKIYTVYLHMADGLIAFKFFKGTGWNGGEPVASDRTYTVNGSCNNIFTWGIDGFVVSARENPLAGNVQMYPNPVTNELNINSTVTISKVIITSTLGQVVGNYAFNNTGNQTINTSALSSGLYFVTFVGKDGNQLTQKMMKN